MNNRLSRSRTDVMISGVCGGLAHYLNINSTLVRLFFVLLAFVGNGIGALIYFLLWMIVPVEGQRNETTLQENVQSGSQEIANQTRAMGEDLRKMVRDPNPQIGLIVGGSLILVGFFYLLDNLGLPWLRWFDFDVLWPILLIVGGLALLLRQSRGE
ncbi:MAG: PspC domain-containing protein [Anaerolineales bacterium]|jgi:phage shock protein C